VLDWNKVSVTPLAGQDDRVFFSLGVVYEMLGLKFCLVHQYMADKGLDRATDIGLITHQCHSTVVSGLQEWSHICQSLPREQAKPFFEWMAMQGFSVPQYGEMFAVGCAGVEIPDPCAIGLAGLVTVTVFLPSGFKSRAYVRYNTNTLSAKIVIKPLPEEPCSTQP
jgi:hypothetical protein